MPTNPYINFNGNCREAMEYYADVFKTEKPKFMTFGEAQGDPNHPIPEEAKHLIMHTEIHIQGTRIMASDVFPGHPFTLGNNISLAVVTPQVQDVHDYFAKLREGGTVFMEPQATFWSKAYGSLTDKYGVGWQLSQEDPA